MRIAFFTDVFIPFTSGVSVSVVDLAKSLADRGHEIHIITPVYKKLVFEYPSVHVKRVPSISAGWIYPGFRFANPFNLFVHRYVQKRRIDVIHFHTPLLVGRLGISIARRLDLPLVGTYHTSVDAKECRKHIKMDGDIFDGFAKRFVDFFYKGCDLVSVPTSTYSDRLEALGLDYPTRVISNGVDLQKFPAGEAKDIRARHPGKIVLSVGRLAQEKNLMFLLKAWPHLQDEAQLILIGGGTHEAELQEYAKKEGLKNIHFLGMIPHEELIQTGYHRAADVFVMTSMVEVQGLALMEAQASGLVSVGINAGGTKDLIVDGENGFLVEPGDQDRFVEVMLQLLRDDGLREHMREATLMEIQKHDVRNVAKEWEEVYEELMARRKGHLMAT
jgi:1,2-diacylglycerol 3-alpha-glucosyltransferase